MNDFLLGVVGYHVFLGLVFALGMDWRYIADGEELEVQDPLGVFWGALCLMWNFARVVVCWPYWMIIAGDE